MVKALNPAFHYNPSFKRINPVNTRVSGTFRHVLFPLWKWQSYNDLVTLSTHAGLINQVDRKKERQWRKNAVRWLWQLDSLKQQRAIVEWNWGKKKKKKCVRKGEAPEKERFNCLRHARLLARWHTHSHTLTHKHTQPQHGELLKLNPPPCNKFCVTARLLFNSARKKYRACGYEAVVLKMTLRSTITVKPILSKRSPQR